MMADRDNNQRLAEPHHNPHHLDPSTSLQPDLPNTGKQQLEINHGYRHSTEFDSDDNESIDIVQYETSEARSKKAASKPFHTSYSPEKSYSLKLTDGGNCISPGPLSSRSTRPDSGYNTEASPANMATPPRPKVFLFPDDDLSYSNIDNPQVPDGSRFQSDQSLLDFKTDATGNRNRPRSKSLLERRTERNNLTISPLRLSPQIFDSTLTHNTRPSSQQRVLDEKRRWSDSQLTGESCGDFVQVIAASDEDTSSGSGNNSSVSNSVRKPPYLRRASNFDSSGRYIGAQSSSSGNDDEDDDEVFYDGSFLGLAPPRRRTKSFSLRTRWTNNLAFEEEDDESESDFKYNPEGRDMDNEVKLINIPSRSISPEYRFERLPTLSQEGAELNYSRMENDDLSPLIATSSLNSSQGFDPTNFYHEKYPINASEDQVFSFDDDIEEFINKSKSTVYSRAITPHVTINKDSLQQSSQDVSSPEVFVGPCAISHIRPERSRNKRPSGRRQLIGANFHDNIEEVCPGSRQGPSLEPRQEPRLSPRAISRPIMFELPPPSLARRSIQHVSVPVTLPGGIRMVGMTGNVSIATQTPHQASQLIKQVLETPLTLPNEVRGTAVSRLRHQSESEVPPSPQPLPDIIPLSRDRSVSAPDSRAMARHLARVAGRQVGRELRRMSDQFNMDIRRLGTVKEEGGPYPASYPETSFLQRFMYRVVDSVFTVPARRDRSSSVDLTGH